MKPILLVMGVIIIFAAGFGAGHYRSVGSGARTDTANSTQQGEPSSSIKKTHMPGGNDLLVHRPPPSASHSQSPLQIQQQHSEKGTALSNPALPPHEMMLSLKEQAQWEALQRELREGELAGLGIMIQSMEKAGLPEEEIKHFRDLKEARAKAPIDELPASNSPPPARTLAEARADFAASLEQTNIPEAERKALLEAHFPQSEPTDGSLPDSSPPALPPHQLQN